MLENNLWKYVLIILQTKFLIYLRIKNILAKFNFRSSSFKKCSELMAIKLMLMRKKCHNEYYNYSIVTVTLLFPNIWNDIKRGVISLIILVLTVLLQTSDDILNAGKRKTNQKDPKKHLFCSKLESKQTDYMLSPEQ